MAVGVSDDKKEHPPPQDESTSKAEQAASPPLSPSGRVTELLRAARALLKVQSRQIQGPAHDPADWSVKETQQGGPKDGYFAMDSGDEDDNNVLGRSLDAQREYDAISVLAAVRVMHDLGRGGCRGEDPFGDERSLEDAQETRAAEGARGPARHLHPPGVDAQRQELEEPSGQAASSADQFEAAPLEGLSPSTPLPTHVCSWPGVSAPSPSAASEPPQAIVSEGAGRALPGVAAGAQAHKEEPFRRAASFAAHFEAAAAEGGSLAAPSPRSCSSPLGSAVSSTAPVPQAASPQEGEGPALRPDTVDAIPSDVAEPPEQAASPDALVQASSPTVASMPSVRTASQAAPLKEEEGSADEEPRPIEPCGKAASSDALLQAVPSEGCSPSTLQPPHGPPSSGRGPVPIAPAQMLESVPTEEEEGLALPRGSVQVQPLPEEQAEKAPPHQSSSPGALPPQASPGASPPHAAPKAAEEGQAPQWGQLSPSSGALARGDSAESCCESVHCDGDSEAVEQEESERAWLQEEVESLQSQLTDGKESNAEEELREELKKTQVERDTLASALKRLEGLLARSVKRRRRIGSAELEAAGQEDDSVDVQVPPQTPPLSSWAPYDPLGLTPSSSLAASSQEKQPSLDGDRVAPPSRPSWRPPIVPPLNLAGLQEYEQEVLGAPSASSSSSGCSTWESSQTAANEDDRPAQLAGSDQGGPVTWTGARQIYFTPTPLRPPSPLLERLQAHASQVAARRAAAGGEPSAGFPQRHPEQAARPLPQFGQPSPELALGPLAAPSAGTARTQHVPEMGERMTAPHNLEAVHPDAGHPHVPGVPWERLHHIEDRRALLEKQLRQEHGRYTDAVLELERLEQAQCQAQVQWSASAATRRLSEDSWLALQCKLQAQMRIVEALRAKVSTLQELYSDAVLQLLDQQQELAVREARDACLPRFAAQETAQGEHPQERSVAATGRVCGTLQQLRAHPAEEVMFQQEVDVPLVVN